MQEQFKNLMMFGLGSASLAKEVAEDFVDEMIRQGKAQNQERSRLVEEFTQKSNDFKVDFEQKMQESMKRIAHEMQLATLEDMQKLQDEVIALRSELHELKEEMSKKAGSKSTSKSKSSSKSS